MESKALQTMHQHIWPFTSCHPHILCWDVCKRCKENSFPVERTGEFPHWARMEFPNYIFSILCRPISMLSGTQIVCHLIHIYFENDTEAAVMGTRDKSGAQISVGLEMNSTDNFAVCRLSMSGGRCCRWWFCVGMLKVLSRSFEMGWLCGWGDNVMFNNYFMNHCIFKDHCKWVLKATWSTSGSNLKPPPTPKPKMSNMLKDWNQISRSD